MFYKNLFIVLFALVFGKSEAQSQYNSGSFNILKKEVQVLADSLNQIGVFSPGDSSTSDFFKEKLLTFLLFPQSDTFNFNVLPNYVETKKSGDGRFKLVTFGGSMEEKPRQLYSFNQFRKRDKEFGTCFIGDVDANEIYHLHSKSSELYLITYEDYSSSSNGDFGAVVYQVKEDSILKNYPAFPNGKPIIELGGPYSDVIDFDEKTQTIILNLKERGFSPNDLSLYPNPTDENGEVNYNYILKFNGTKFVQVAK